MTRNCLQIIRERGLYSLYLKYQENPPNQRQKTKAKKNILKMNRGKGMKRSYLLQIMTRKYDMRGFATYKYVVETRKRAYFNSQI